MGTRKKIRLKRKVMKKRRRKRRKKKRRLKTPTRPFTNNAKTRLHVKVSGITLKSAKSVLLGARALKVKTVSKNSSTLLTALWNVLHPSCSPSWYRFQRPVMGSH